MDEERLYELSLKGWLEIHRFCQGTRPDHTLRFEEPVFVNKYATYHCKNCGGAYILPPDENWLVIYG